MAEGTYLEAINFDGKAITVRSATDNPNTTIIDGEEEFHVVQCVGGEGPDSVLRGFTITGGNANGPAPDDRGGGMFNDGSSPTIINCVFTGNMAEVGGAMRNSGGSPTVTNCTFDENFATNNSAGMHNVGGGIPIVTNCTFSASAGGFGGGMFNMNSSPVITNCTFSYNSVTSVFSRGGGVYNSFGSSSTMTNCAFIANSAVNSGGRGVQQ